MFNKDNSNRYLQYLWQNRSPPSYCHKTSTNNYTIKRQIVPSNLFNYSITSNQDLKNKILILNTISIVPLLVKLFGNTLFSSLFRQFIPGTFYTYSSQHRNFTPERSSGILKLSLPHWFSLYIIFIHNSQSLNCGTIIFVIELNVELLYFFFRILFSQQHIKFKQQFNYTT